MTKGQTKEKCVAKQLVKLDALPEMLTVSSDVSWRDVNDETIILNLKTGEYFTLNDTAKFLWKAICDNKQPSELVQLLAHEYGLRPEEVEADVLDFIEGLTQKDVFEYGS
jgi:hypothetical protein